MAASWRRAWAWAWDRVITFFAFPPAVRRVVYTTNARESVYSWLRKIIMTRGHFLSDDVATKLIWLALRNITADWGRTDVEQHAKPRSDSVAEALAIAALRQVGLGGARDVAEQGTWQVGAGGLFEIVTAQDAAQRARQSLRGPAWRYSSVAPVSLTRAS
jgi:hypothetical protein